MGSRIVNACMKAGITAAFALTAGIASAQQSSDNQVNAVTDWSVFVENEPKECWAVSTAKETVNTKEGRVVAVRRSDILMMVVFRPSVNVSGQVGFTGGYPFAKGSTVNLDVDGTDFELFTEGEWAWPASTAEDAKIVTAMKRGAKAVLTARSSRGTKTVDTFSLLGFTASVEDAEKRCK
ncbi:MULTISPECIES: invasion associated locus B family protein [Shimia]|uniref:invasion associated locus B family protein n=1 Tax=Shimia TaxID=573139 RepID=UPI001FB2790D|nr:MULTISPECIES: invasion associated locus B family protein [Shimia]MDV4144752.1 invasion associated locus B family protein [Shimia sp. FJ5]